jgi:hypothetical protein
MPRLTVATEQVNTLAEDALHALKEQGITLGVLEKAQKNIEALQHARSIERAELVADIEHCRADLRLAESRLARYDEIDEQCDGIHLETMQLIVSAEQQLAEDVRIVATDAQGAGFVYVDKDLLKPGSMVAKRRQMKENGEVSAAEAEVI